MRVRDQTSRSIEFRLASVGYCATARSEWHGSIFVHILVKCLHQVGRMNITDVSVYSSFAANKPEAVWDPDSELTCMDDRSEQIT